MKKLMGLILFVSSFAYAEVPRFEQMNEIFRQFSLRYTTGRYVKDAALIKDFNLKQDAMAGQLKKSGGLKKVLLIENDHDQNLNVTIFAFIDEQNSILGFYWEKSKYFDEEERSFLRFARLDMVAAGLKFIPLSGAHALIVKGFHFDAAKGGTLQLNYLKEFRTKATGSINVFISKKNDQWSAFSEQSQPVSRGLVKVWTGFLNGGVKEISLN